VFIKEKTLYDAHVSLMILTSLTGQPITFDYREQSTTQWNFSDFILSCCLSGALTAGDFLVVDNAAVHNG